MVIVFMISAMRKSFKPFFTHTSLYTVILGLTDSFRDANSQISFGALYILPVVKIFELELEPFLLFMRPAAVQNSKILNCVYTPMMF